MRSRQRPTARDRKHAGREKRIKKPVSTFPQQITYGEWSPIAEARLRDSVERGERGRQDPRGRNKHPGAQFFRESHRATVSRARTARNDGPCVLPFASAGGPLAYSMLLLLVSRARMPGVEIARRCVER